MHTRLQGASLLCFLLPKWPFNAHKEYHSHYPVFMTRTHYWQPQCTEDVMVVYTTSPQCKSKKQASFLPVHSISMSLASGLIKPVMVRVWAKAQPANSAIRKRESALCILAISLYYHIETTPANANTSSHSHLRRCSK